MSITLNAFQISVPDDEITLCSIPYDEARLEELRLKYESSHVARRQGEEIVIVSSNGTFPVEGKKSTVKLADNYGLLCYLVKKGILSHLHTLGRTALGFNPIDLVSIRPEDNLIATIVGADYPFQVFVKFVLDTRIIAGRPCLIIDSSTRRNVSENCQYFIKQGFDLEGRYIVAPTNDGFRKLVGSVQSVAGDEITVAGPDGTAHSVSAQSVYLEGSIENFDDYIAHTHGTQKDAVVESIRKKISIFNGGDNKRSKIDSLKRYFQSKGIPLITGAHANFAEAPDIESQCKQLQKPVFVFNDNGQADWAEKGLKQYGPYTRRTFDRNDPSVCVICAQHDKGRVEQFVRKLLKGIAGSKYFANGLEGKFGIGTSRVEVFTTPTDDVAGYRAAIEAAIQKKSEDGGRWDLALVQVRQGFKKLNVKNNPYYLGKSLFYLHQVPVQDFTIELLSQNDYSLGFSLNNMALACYAKMSGVPWLLKSSPTISHELVVGIGSANVGHERGLAGQRIMGITTVFSGDGSYILSNTSKAVPPDQYCKVLTSVLSDTIQKIQKRMNWQKGDTIRLIFHASVKRFNRDEIEAVKAMMDKFREYHIEYAFLKISEDHGLHMFDSSSSDEKKGRWAPQRGKVFQLSKYEMLIYLIGQRELRQDSDGHPRGIILNVHKDSTFKDLKYLSGQLYSFASHSWRSYFPNPMPVTITYSDLIAKNLGWLNQLPGWNDSVMVGKIGQSQWFL